MALKLKGSTSGFVAIDAPSVAGNNTLILPENTGSAHQILANDITAGVTTFTQITVSRNGDLTVPGTISIGGTLTYEDVTSVDSVGIVTARGLSIFGNTTGLQVASGISTFQAISLSGNTSGLSVTGVGTFAGDVSIADKIVHTGHTDTTIRFAGDSIVTVECAGTEHLRVDTTATRITDKLAHFGDPDTQIRFPAADTFTVETAGSERIRINSSGNFGVATASPAQKFHVYGNSGTTAIALGDNSTTQPYMLLEANETDNLCTVHSRTNNPLTFKVNNSEKMRITSSGDLGLGTNSPSDNLHLAESGATNNYIRFSNSNVSDGWSVGAQSGGRFQIVQNGVADRFIITSAGIIQCGTSGTLKAEINNAVSGHQFISQCSDNNNGFEIYQQHGSTATRNTLAVYDNRGNSGAKQLSFAVVGNGNAKIQDGDLIIGTSGHGIDFSATGDGSGTDSSELFDDYEEGTWTPLIRNSSGTGTAGASNYGYYTKVGNVVHAHATVHWTALSGGTTSALVVIAGLPYTTKNASNYRSTTLIGGQIVGVHNGANDGMNIAIGCDANMSAVYVTAVNGAATSGGNYTHYPTVLSTGTIYGFAFTYLT